VIVLLAWAAAAVLAAVVLAVLAFELRGHVKRLTAAVAQVSQDLAPLARRLAARPDPDASGTPAGPATGWLAGPGRHRADP
jgi:hypothetical protein